ncbi:hypothetical protein [Symmachiella macrocystis]|nr:hypothetical protein [Symmachiella macrocystis]
MVEKLLFTLACLVLPVLWGIVVNWLFVKWQNRNPPQQQADPNLPDYQI